MKKVRSLLFGYQVTDGKITVNQQEAEIVKYIFLEYLKGSSCQTIADELTGRQIPYREDADKWNRSILKRVLDNRKYIGEDGYPMLVDAEVFNHAFRLKAGKYTRKNIVPSPVVSALKGKVICYECGARFNRRFDARFPPKWYCTADNCHTDFKIIDDYLFNRILVIFNEVIADPSVLTLHDQTSCATNLEIMRLNNGIGREIEKQEPDRAHVRLLILECAAKRYECCEDESSPAVTEMMKAEFENRNILTEIDPELIGRTVDAVLVEKNGTVHMRFKNSKVISYDTDG